MASKDFHYNTLPVVALNITAIGSSTTTVGNITDNSRFDALEYFIQSGTITDGTYTPVLEHGDDPALADVEEVPINFRLGTYSDATFIATEDNTVKSIGYVGKKRYSRIKIVSTGVTTGGTFGVIAMKAAPRHNPTKGSDTPTG